MDKEWIESRIEALKKGITVNQQQVSQKNAEVVAHERQIQSNLGAIAILNEQLEVINGSAAGDNAT